MRACAPHLDAKVVIGLISAAARAEVDRMSLQITSNIAELFLGRLREELMAHSAETLRLNADLEARIYEKVAEAVQTERNERLSSMVAIQSAMSNHFADYPIEMLHDKFQCGPTCKERLIDPPRRETGLAMQGATGSISACARRAKEQGHLTRQHAEFTLEERLGRMSALFADLLKPETSHENAQRGTYSASAGIPTE